MMLAALLAMVLKMANVPPVILEQVITTQALVAVYTLLQIISFICMLCLALVDLCCIITTVMT